LTDNNGKSWLDLVVESNANNEAPERFFWWCGLATIAAIIRDQVWLDRHYYLLFPNIYVLILSEKSGLKKGVPIAMAKRLVRAIDNTKLIIGQSSIQGIIKELSSQFTEANRSVKTGAQGILIASELAASMTEDPTTWSILTDLHNTHEHKATGWTKTLKGSPKEELTDLCLSVLIASNKRLFEDTIKAKDIEGGFIARTFIVAEAKRKMINSLVTKPEGIISDEVLLEYLRLIKGVKGPFQWTKDGGDYYTSWYDKLDAIMNSSDDRTGTLERLGDQVLKAAMLISLSKGFDLKLKLEDIQESIIRCEECVSGIRMIESSGRSSISPIVARVIQLLVAAPEHKLSRKAIQRVLRFDADHMELDRTVETLLGAGVIDQPFRDSSREITYKMTEETYKMYTRFKKEEII
jgi:hypothetical protein